jgi:hypothetical protein
MRWIALVVVIAPLVALAIGALTGRVQARSCCSVADPRRDLRMAGVFDDVPAPRPSSAPPVSPAAPPARTAR